MLYHWAGFVLVWGVVAVLVAAACYRIYTHAIEPHWGNAILWVRVFVFRKQWRLTRKKASILIAAYQKSKQLARWERNIIARSIRDARRRNWPEPA